MKTGQSLVVLFATIILGSCFDPPEFPNVPEIAFDHIEFHDAPEPKADSLILYISFKDGDGDLGLSSQLPEHRSFPYHSSIYYQAAGNGVLNPLSTSITILPDGDTLNLLEIPDASAGRLVFPRTRKDPAYSFLPVSTECVNYEYVRNIHLHVRKNDQAVLDDTVKIVDSTDFGGIRYYEFLDTLYYTLNPNHANIDVQFLVFDRNSQDPDHPGFTEFNWHEVTCQTLNARFPILSDNNGSALEGTLRYSMYSAGFNDYFAGRQMKLRIRIRDRALNLSNTIETPLFSLQEI